MRVDADAFGNIVELTRMLGEFGQIMRKTRMPNGAYESDSHHSFALALVSYEIATTYAPELDTQKILLYSLVHDLTELITGDVPTLTSTPEELAKKAKRDHAALAELKPRLKNALHIWQALVEYEEKANDEATFVYWVDKMITVPTHFFDNFENLHALGVENAQHIDQWYTHLLEKLHTQAKTPHESAAQFLEIAYQALREQMRNPQTS